MKKIKETAAERTKRLAEIERLFSLIRTLIASGDLEGALDVRAQADKLRIFWK